MFGFASFGSRVGIGVEAEMTTDCFSCMKVGLVRFGGGDNGFCLMMQMEACLIFIVYCSQ